MGCEVGEKCAQNAAARRNRNCRGPFSSFAHLGQRMNVAKQPIERSGYEKVSIRLCRIFCCFPVGNSSSAGFQMERLRIPRSGYEYECRERKSHYSHWRRRRGIYLPGTQLRCGNWTCHWMVSAWQDLIPLFLQRPRALVGLTKYRVPLSVEYGGPHAGPIPNWRLHPVLRHSTHIYIFGDNRLISTQWVGCHHTPMVTARRQRVSVASAAQSRSPATSVD